jgi:transposase
MCLYVRPLSESERQQVEELARGGDAVSYRHARVILLSAQRQRVPQIVPLTGLSERWVRALLHRFNTHGVAALPRRKAPGQPPRCDAAARTALLELLRRSPTEFGIESATWTGVELARVAQEQGLPAMSARTARREIRRAGYGWQQAKRWSRKEPEYERKKAAATVGGPGTSQPSVGSGV